MKLFIAGHNGMVGGALVRRFEREAGVSLLLRTRRELDLTSQAAVDAFYAAEKPDVAIIAAAKVGGIHANSTYPAEFFFDNLAIALNTINSAYKHGVKRLLFLGSSCIYPKFAPQPLHEDALLTGPLEPTNEAYAIAKITGLKQCQYYRKQYGVMFHSAMPTNLYGPGDNYHPQNSHVMPALIRRFDEAREAGKSEVVAWGSGSPMREFLHVDDLAEACSYLLKMENPPDWINVGTGVDVTIRELTETVAAVTGFRGKIVWDATKPDGTPRKLMDVSRLAKLGWKSKIGLREGIESTFANYQAEKAAGKLRSV
ncbi:MAG: GDP-L-fucose synthase [Verrucomicrobiota bacterium]